MATDYLQLFVSESKEHVDKLNNALLDLEKDTSNKEALNEIFRSMHTLKGMAKSMGFEKISKLTHTFEDELDEIRQGDGEVHPDIVDILFESLDILEELIEKVASGEEEDRDISEVLDKLSKFKTGRSGDKSKKEKKLNEYNVIIKLSETCQIKAVRVFLVFKNLKKIGEIKGSNPSLQQLEDEDFESQFEVHIATEKDKEKIKELIETLPEIESVNVSGVKKEQKKKEDVKIKDTSIQSVRVSIDRLDSILNLMGELIINKARLGEIAKKHTTPGLDEALGRNERLINDMQYEVMQIRMVPVERVFGRFPRVVRDLAKGQGKEVDFILEGKEIELDRTVLDEIAEPMIHLLRNSIDHGIESPSDREKMGKPRKAIVRVSASRERDHVVISVGDDGKGIDAEKVKETALKRGVLTKKEAAQISDADALKLIFKPGFSTKEEVTSISGRGVGMDVVKTKIESLGGSVLIDSEIGKGTKVLLELPLTLAIIQALLIEINQGIYAIPMANVNKIVDVLPKDIKSIRNEDVIKLYEEVIPIIRNLYNVPVVDNETKKDGERESLSVVIIERGSNKVGLVVDDILSQQEIVIKSLGSSLGEVKGFSGATILGDGSVALILDTSGIFGYRGGVNG